MNTEVTAVSTELTVEERLTLLTKREKEVFEHVMQGKTGREIGAALTISFRTVELHRTRICEKLGVHGVVPLILLVMNDRLERLNDFCISVQNELHDLQAVKDGVIHEAS